MNLSKSDVRTIASLAQLQVDDEQLAHYAEELSNIMEMIHDMQQIDTSSVEPLSHPQDIHLRLREDVVTESEQREALQKIAPQAADGYYLVPKVID